MIVSGYPEEVFGDVEVVDLSTTFQSCTKPANFSGGNKGAIGTYIDGTVISLSFLTIQLIILKFQFLGKPMVCGGERLKSNGLFQLLNSCYFWEKEGNFWTRSSPMKYERFMPGNVMINESAWWVSSWENKNDEETEIYTTSNGWSQYVKSPLNSTGHCLLKINDTHYFATGDHKHTESYIFNMETEKWTAVDNSSKPRLYATCGTITRPGGEKEIILSAGKSYDGLNEYKDTDIFSPKTMKWRKGPDFPFKIRLALGIPYGDTFLAVGGFDGDTFGTIYKYDNVNDGWKVLPHRLKKPRAVYTAFLIPNTAIEC